MIIMLHVFLSSFILASIVDNEISAVQYFVMLNFVTFCIRLYDNFQRLSLNLRLSKVHEIIPKLEQDLAQNASSNSSRCSS